MTGWLPPVPDIFGFGDARLTYTGLYQCDLATLAAAADQWETVESGLEELSMTARHDMLGGARDAGWAGENADATRPFIDRTCRRFEGAHAQARAIRSLLLDLHGDLLAGQRALRSLETTAREQGVLIDPEGVVRSVTPPHLTLPEALARQALPTESDETDAAAVHAMQETQEEIRRIVDTAAESDRLTARALTEMASAGGEQFAGSPYNDATHAHDSLIAEDAAAFVALARQADPTAADLHRMNRLLEDHADDPEFAAHIVDTIGMEEYLLLAERTETTATRLNSDGTLAADLRQGLGTALSTSLRPAGDMSSAPPGSPAYLQWLQTSAGQQYQERYDAFHESGNRLLHEPSPLDRGSADQRVGYDVAFDLLEASDVPVDDQFFYQTTSRLIELEQETPGIWSHDRFPERESPWLPSPWDAKNDLVDRMLGIGAHSNPDAVTAFFDPEGPGAEHLDYFIGEGDEARHAAVGATPSPLHAQWQTTPPGPGLQAALEAAATGLPPGEPPPPGEHRTHSEANARVAETVWNEFAADYAGSDELSDIKTPRIAEGEPFADLRPALGAIAADYMPDVQQTLSGARFEPRPEPQAEFDPGRMSLMLFDIGTAPEAYASITAANEAYTHVAVDQAVNGDWPDEGERMRHLGYAAASSGQVTGIMTDARATAVYEQHIASDSQFNTTLGQVGTWTERALSSTVDEGLGRIPVVGPPAAELRSALTESIFGSFTRDSQPTAAEQTNRNYAETKEYYETYMRDAVEDAARRGGIDVEVGEADDLKSTASLQFGGGFEDGVSEAGRL
ncbi:hypothetical protein [Streptomyces sp. MP131-18]|uniref:hypothetical protein n=1 Tax=Streptomyces sp. MP131-18 TaxID=1857892 RepID=UPI00097BC036|nr:hypothetical protein [Streptomyces sp. MP131-18]ONK11089.1 hypothetical protein STBA_18170 [Streptomyces sp. MP131-18]